MNRKKSKLRRGGQAVLMSVLFIGALILGATTIAGFLTIIQLRQSTDVSASAKAVFAADAGVNCALYEFRHRNNVPPSPPCFTYTPGTVTTGNLVLTNGSQVAAVCYENANFNDPDSDVPCDDDDTLYVLSRGSSGNTRRAFLYTVIAAP